MARINLGKVVPEKGVDYFTAEEVAEFKQEITGELDSRITQNANDIATNTQNIAANTQAIEGLDEEVEGNTENIQNNADAISRLATRVGDVEGDIETIQTTLQEQAGDIDTLQQQQTQQDTQLQEHTTALEALEEIPDRVEDLEEEQDEQDSKIQELEAECQSLRDDLNNSTLSVEGTGEVVELKNTANAQYKELQPSGFSTQETTTGANILKFTERTTSSAGIAYSCNSIGQVKITGTATNGVGYAYNQSADAITLNAGNYKVKVIGTFDGLELNRTDNRVISLNSNNEGTVVIENDNTNFRILIATTTGITYNADFYITLTPGEIATEERYTGGIPKPNIDYPSDIENLGSDGNLVDVSLDKLLQSTSQAYRNFTVNEETKSVLVTGNALFGFKAKVLPNTQYSAGYVIDNGSGSRTLRIREYSQEPMDWNDNYIQQPIQTNANSGTPNATFITSPNTTWVSVVLYAEYTGDGMNIREWQVTKSTQLKNYVPYDNLRFKGNAENMFNPKDITFRSGAIQFEVVDGKLTITATGTAGAQIVQEHLYNMDKTKTYTMYFKAKKTVAGSAGSPGINVRIYGSNDKGKTWGPYIKSIYQNSPEVNTEYTLLGTFSGYEWYRFYIYNNAGNPVTAGEQTEYYDMMLLEGEYTLETIPQYMPYQEQIVDFPLEGQKLYAGSTLTDNEISHIRKQILLQGASSEHWAPVSLINEETLLFVLDRPGDILYGVLTHGEIICNRLPNYNCYGPTNTREGLCVHQTGGLYVRIKRSTLAGETVADFKNWLAENPLTVEYPLAEPETIPYTQAQEKAYKQIKKMKSFKDFTMLQVGNANQNATTYVKAVKDINSVVTELTTAIVALGGVE